jgi:hypothetical protein
MAKEKKEPSQAAWTKLKTRMGAKRISMAMKMKLARMMQRAKIEPGAPPTPPSERDLIKARERKKEKLTLRAKGRKG